MSACKASYSPAAMIAILAIAFVDGNLPPAIDSSGKPVYSLVDAAKTTTMSGCAMTTIIMATAKADMFRTIAALGTHESCPASKLPSKGVPLAAILAVPSWGFFVCYSGHDLRAPRSECSHCAKTLEKFIQFFTDLQSCHDTAAVFYYNAISSGIPVDTALPAFRRLVGSLLEKVATTYFISEKDVAEARASLVPAIQESIPAAQVESVAVRAPRSRTKVLA